MTIQRAIEVLLSHNAWRRGADIEMAEPKELGKAIEKAIEVLRKSK